MLCPGWRPCQLARPAPCRPRLLQSAFLCVCLTRRCASGLPGDLHNIYMPEELHHLMTPDSPGWQRTC